MIDLIDVQSGKPKYPIPIGEVGVKGIRYPIRIVRGDRSINLNASIDIYADIPGTRKGADFSRNVEAINEVILSETVTEGVEDLALKLAKKVLVKLPYSNSSRVVIEAEYLRETRDHGNRIAVIPYILTGNASATRNGDMEKGIQVRVKGITACPCAMETTRSMLSMENPGNDALLNRLPSITHNQRNTISLGFSGLTSEKIEADDLIEVAESAMGGPLYSLLKREDEGKIVYSAHKNPMFVEDIVREISVRAFHKYADLPSEVLLMVSSESEESIHPHNAFARVSLSMGELNKIIGKKSD